MSRTQLINLLEKSAALAAIAGALAYACGRLFTDGFYDRLGIDAEEVGRDQVLITIRAALPLGLLILLALGIALALAPNWRPKRLAVAVVLVLVPLAAFGARWLGWRSAGQVQRGEVARSGLITGLWEPARWTADLVCLKGASKDSTVRHRGPFVYLGSARGFIVLYDYGGPNLAGDAGKRIVRLPVGTAVIEASTTATSQDTLRC